MDLKQILLAAIVLVCHQVSSYVDDFEEFEEDRENLLQDSLQSAILRGSDIGDRKFYVRVEYKGSNEFCGGVFIHHLWILTAASCLQGENRAYIRLFSAQPPLTIQNFPFQCYSSQIMEQICSQKLVCSPCKVSLQNVIVQ